MKRREFLRNSILTTAFLSMGGYSLANVDSKFKSKTDWPKRDDNWKYMGKKDTSSVKREKEYVFDVAVIGGGVAGRLTVGRYGRKRKRRNCLNRLAVSRRLLHRMQGLASPGY